MLTPPWMGGNLPTMQILTRRGRAHYPRSPLKHGAARQDGADASRLAKIRSQSTGQLPQLASPRSSQLGRAALVFSRHGTTKRRPDSSAFEGTTPISSLGSRSAWRFFKSLLTLTVFSFLAPLFLANIVPTKSIGREADPQKVADENGV